MGVLYIDKPKGYTSFDVCHKLRRVLNTKKVGHTGTLDPNATGVLVVLYGQDVKGDQFLVGHDKKYIGTCLIGKSTDTLDVEGKIIEEKDEIMPKKELIEKTMSSFIGKQLQYPPMASAIKVNGKRLFEYHRDGKEIEIKPRLVHIFDFRLLSISDNEFTFMCHVSSGTYIRSLLKDLLDKLNILGMLKELRRTDVGNININICNKLEDVLNGNYQEHSLLEVLKDYYEVINVEDPKDAMIGKKLKIDSENEYVLIASNNKCIAIYEKDGNVYKSKRGLF